MIELTLISNAGILIKVQEIRLLVDGIQSEGSFPFSKTPPKLLQEMMAESSGICNNLDYLVFSHMHPDYFTPDLAAEYLNCNHVSRILFPDVRGRRTKRLFDTLLKTNTPYWCFPWKRGSLRFFRLSRLITLTVLCTRHMPQLYADDLCSALMITTEEKNILFLTDCSCAEIPLLNQFSQAEIHTVFVNPYFYHEEAGRQFLQESIHPVKTVIYHLPFPEDDTLKIGALAKQDADKFPRNGLVLFQEPFQTLTIP